MQPPNWPHANEARRIAGNIAKLPGLVLRLQYLATFGLSITFECSLCRSLLRLITRSEAIVRAARLELAVAIFIPSGVKVTTNYGSPSFGGS